MARFISSGESAATNASSVTYDNATSGLDATNAKTALDELEAEKQTAGSGQSTAEDIGTVSTGTITLQPSDGALKTLTNGGAFIWAAPTQEGGYIAYMLNNGSAGAITPSGFDHEQSSIFNTVDTNEFEVAVTNDGIRKIMTVRPLQ